MPGQAPAAARSADFEPHNCFACGSLNEHGLGLQLHLEHERAWADLTVDPRFEGWAGIAHGGIIAVVLDEVMAWALVAREAWGVTARMTIDFKRPVPIGSTVRGEGWVVRTRRRLFDTAGQIVDAQGLVLATAEAVYVAADETRKRELQARYGYRGATTRPAWRAATPEQVDVDANAGVGAGVGAGGEQGQDRNRDLATDRRSDPPPEQRTDG